MRKILLFLALVTSYILNAQFQVNTLEITTNDLVYDAVTNKIYASIPSENGANGNSIGIINPANFYLRKNYFYGK